MPLALPQLTHRGALDSGALAVAYRGTQQVFLESPFKGGLLAPNADVFVRSGFTGELGARTIDVGPDLTVSCQRPEDVGSTPPPTTGIQCGYARPTKDGPSFFTLLALGFIAAGDLGRWRRRRRSVIRK